MKKSLFNILCASLEVYGLIITVVDAYRFFMRYTSTATRKKSERQHAVITK